jgi:L-ascorbate metabolism protein UlaG (beta-lactamase superfamily)
MKQLWSLFLMLACSASAQRISPDQIQTSKGLLSIQPIFHGCVVLSWNALIIYVDPYGGLKAFDGLAAPDLILITDIHSDHLNLETLKTLETKSARFIVPQAVADQLPENLKAKTIVLKNGENINELGISISAIPMYNLPEDSDSKHLKGRGNGYILKISDKVIYLSGDTEDISEMRSLKNIDVAFVCMNLPYTMSIDQAASAVLEFKPKIVYPYHYRGKDELSDTEAFKKLVNTNNSAIEVRLRNWYPEY